MRISLQLHVKILGALVILLFPPIVGMADAVAE